MNYVVTNIRIPEEDYLRLKSEAAKNRKSFSAVVREKIILKQNRQRAAEKLVSEMRKLAEKNAKYFKGVDAVKTIREIRYQGKW